MQITIFGASGKVGRQVVALALKRGYTVVAFVHKNNPFEDTPNLIVKKGDVYDVNSVADALKNSQAVISTLSSWGTPQRNVLTSAMRAIIPAMEAQNITRIITLTGSGAADPSKPAGAGYKLMLKLLAPFPAGKVFKDGEEHMRLLFESKLDWTTIRSPVMTNSGKVGYELNLKSGLPLATIQREAVAAALVDQLESGEFSCQAPIIHRK
jgi:putative NADH-flavin reductase